MLGYILKSANLSVDQNSFSSRSLNILLPKCCPSPQIYFFLFEFSTHYPTSFLTFKMFQPWSLLSHHWDLIE